MKRGNDPEGTPKIGSRKKLEDSLHRKLLGMIHIVGKKIQSWVHRYTTELSTFIPDRLRSWVNRGVDVEEFGVPRENPHYLTAPSVYYGYKWSDIKTRQNRTQVKF